MMVALQVLCKCISAGNIDLIEDNQLDVEYFNGYEEEYSFVTEHYKKYGNTPDTATFLSKFPDIDFVQVNESDKYLVDTIREERLFNRSVPIVQRVADLLKTDANAAVEYMLTSVRSLQPNYDLGGIDIVADAMTRYNEFTERKDKQSEWFYTTGFPELDDAIHGLQRQEEFFVIYARTNHGKSWVLEKIMTHIWQLGADVGYISPEMGPSSIGFRFDTLLKQFSNRALMWGKDDISNDEYKEYIDELMTRKNKFIVATPADFDRRITITKLRNWIKQFNLQAIAIDGITYLSDERGKRGDSKTISLTNISEDLMGLSIELKIPILAVVQANRSGVIGKDKDTDSNELPELESIRDSDGISFNATKILSLRQNKDGDLLMQVKKQRNGIVGTKIAYKWKADIGEFINIPLNSEMPTDRPHREARKQTDKEDVF